MSKIEIKGWPAIIAFALVTWPFWLVYGIVRTVAWLIMGALVYGVLYPIDKIYHKVKKYYHEHISSSSRNS